MRQSGRPSRSEERRAPTRRAAHGTASRPRGGTRERILDIALDLFNEHGYDKTSLREIAEQLGFTKAALYYHFERKEDILLELHLRLHALGREMLERLGNAPEGHENVAEWSELLDHFIDQVMKNRKLFLLHERNQNAFESLSRNKRHELEHEDHEDVEQQLRRFLENPAIPLAQRVRMACSLGAVMGVFMGVGTAFEKVPAGELAQLVREAVGDLIGPLDEATRRSPSRPSSAGRRDRRR